MSPLLKVLVSAGLILALTIPIWWGAIPSLLGVVFPVTSKVAFTDVKEVEGGVVVRMRFEKYYETCAYVGVSMDKAGEFIEFERVDGGLPIQLPRGERVSAPWFVGVAHEADLTGVRLRWVHTCAGVPFPVVTVGYP